MTADRVKKGTAGESGGALYFIRNWDLAGPV